MSSWNEAPDFETVREAIAHLGQCEIELEIAELELKRVQGRIERQKPRTPYAKVVGVDEETEKQLIAAQDKVAECRRASVRAKTQMDFLQYWRDMFKATSYAGRL